MGERSSAQHLFQYITKLHVPGVTFLADLEIFKHSDVRLLFAFLPISKQYSSIILVEVKLFEVLLLTVQVPVKD